MASIEQKNKLSIMNSMMSNPQISKTLHKAFKAKLGSTDRKKGQDLIAIFSKIDPRKDYTGMGGVFDGKGGPSIPGYSNVPESMQKQRALETSITNPVSSPFIGPMPLMGPTNTRTSILPTVPAMVNKTFNRPTIKGSYTNNKSVIPNFRAHPERLPNETNRSYNERVLGPMAGMVVDRLGAYPKVQLNEPKWYSEEHPDVLKAGIGNRLAQDIPTAIGKVVSTAANPVLKGFSQIYGLAGDALKGAGDLGAGAIMKLGDLWNTAFTDVMKPTPGPMSVAPISSTPAKQKIITENTDANGNTKKITEEVTGGGSEEKVAGVVEGPKVEQTGAIDPTTGKPFSDPTKTEEVTNVESGGGSTLISQTGSSQTGSSQTGSSQTGSSQNGGNVTSTPVPGGKPNGADLETLKMAFEGTPVENMPVGKDYQKQLYEIQTLVETENNVNGLKKQAEDLQNQAPNVKIEYADYIRGKDEAISQIDKMLSEAYDVYSSGGLTPEASDRQKQYITMLEGMKANHNVSYTKFLNRSIDQFNSEVNRVDNLYRSAINQANIDYERKGSLIKADYETHLNNYIETQKAIEAANKTNNDSLENYYKSLGLTIEGALLPIKAGEATAEKAKIAKNENFSYGDNGNEINPNVTLANLLVTVIEDEMNHPQQTFEVTASAIRNRLKSVAESDGPEKALNELSTKWIQQIKDIITEPQMGGASPVWKDNSKQLAGLVLSETTPIVKNYISDNFDAIKKAMTGLNPVNRKFLWDKPAKTRDEFITDNSSKLSPIILDTIYDMYSKMTQNNNGVPVPIADLMSVAETKGFESEFEPETSLGGKIATAYINRLRSEVNAQ